MKNKKDGGRNAEDFFGFQRRFLGIFFALATPHGFRSNSKENKNPVFITFLGLKDCGGFKGRREMARYQVVPFAISANFGCNLPVLKADERWHDIRWYRSLFLQTLVVIFPRKSTQVKIHTKMAIFSWFLARKTQ